MRRVLKESTAARKDFDEDAVHDLRTALRRCRSIAIAMQEVDPSANWREMEEQAKRLLDGMSILRDAQVVHALISRFAIRGAAVDLLVAETHKHEKKGERKAAKRLRKFDEKRWREWEETLPERAARIPVGGEVLQLLGVERWNECWERHRFAMRSRSKLSIHKLRVSVKRFRYFAENCLPGRHERWSGDLRKMQDVLGDIHDLDVLWSHVVRLRNQISQEEREHWRAEIEARRRPLLAEYLKMAKPPVAIWQKWRGDLPSGPELDHCRVELLAEWAAFLDPHPGHARQVAKLALQIFDGLHAAGLTASGVRQARILLEAAALVHDVGLHHAHKNHHKETYNLVTERNPPPGWTKQRMELIAAIARYHRGAMPQAGAMQSTRLAGHEAAGILFLAGILRLAVALASDPARQIKRVHVSAQPTEVAIRAVGYDGAEPMASELASARHLLETELDRPVMIAPHVSASAA
jgi:CHAD domain-containing protein